ncbi:MAG TPA: helix-turn-helix domain-containing protein [Alphaproteobacteria bacterium]
MEKLSFDIPEILSLIGLTQCVYVLVYMLFRAGDVRRAVLPFVYFFVLGGAFFLDFAQRFISEAVPHYDDLRWAGWVIGPPLSVLLIIQIAQITRIPRWFNFAILLLVPAAYAAAHFATLRIGQCTQLPDCTVFRDALSIAGLIAGAVSVLAIWLNRGMMEGLTAEKTGKDRYWLILTLVFVNLAFLAVTLLALTSVIAFDDVRVIHTCMGLALVYLSGTSLFRIYPQAVTIVEPRGREMNADETGLARRIEALMNVEKVYHEPGYNRADLARELKIPESVVSRIINLHFGKSLPQLLNEKRVEDAKRMLAETDAPIKIVATESGFNSLASFNRIFRDATGKAPSIYREDFLAQN